MAEQDPEAMFQYVSPPRPSNDPNWSEVDFDRVDVPDPKERVTITVVTGVLDRIQTGDLKRPLSRSELESLDRQGP